MSATHPLRISPPNEFVAPTPTVAPHAQTVYTCLTAPIILLPHHPTIKSILPSEQLYKLLPNLHKYTTSSQPSLVHLPTDSLTHHGLETAIRWREANSTDPTADFAATVDELMEIYHALAYLGNTHDMAHMCKLEMHIRRHINQTLSLEELDAVWPLRRFETLKPFVDLVVSNLTDYARHFMALIEEVEIKGSVDHQEEDLMEQLGNGLKIINYIRDDKELLARVTGLQAARKPKKKKSKTHAMKGKGKMVWYFRDRMVRSRSAVKCFRRCLETVEEDDEES